MYNYSDSDELVLSMYLNNEPFCIHLVDSQRVFNFPSDEFHAIQCDGIETSSSLL